MTQGTEELTTSDRLSIRVNRLALPEGGERKRNLTTMVLVRNSGSETESVPTKSSQSPLRIRSVQVEGVKEVKRPRFGVL